MLILLAHACTCSRYDYEEVATDAANKVMAQVAEVVSKSQKGTKMGDFTLDFADNFEYVDPIDGSKASKQGLRFVFTGACMQQGLRHGFTGTQLQQGLNFVFTDASVQQGLHTGPALCLH